MSSSGQLTDLFGDIRGDAHEHPGIGSRRDAHIHSSASKVTVGPTVTPPHRIARLRSAGGEACSADEPPGDSHGDDAQAEVAAIENQMELGDPAAWLVVQERADPMLG